MKLAQIKIEIRKLLPASHSKFNFEAEKVKAFWRVGHFLSKQSSYSESLRALAADLHVEEEFLEKSPGFYHAYKNKKPWLTNLGWRQYLILLDVEDGGPRSFYEHEAIRHAWDLQSLQKNIRDQIFERRHGLGESTILADAGRRGKAVGSLHNHVQVAAQTL